MGGHGIGINEGTELGFPDGKIVGTSLGDMDRLELGINEGNELGLWYVRVLCTTLGTYDGDAVGYLFCSTDGTADVKFEGLVLDE